MIDWLDQNKEVIWLIVMGICVIAVVVCGWIILKRKGNDKNG